MDFIVTERCVIARSDRAQRILNGHKNNADTHERDGRNEVINTGDDAEIVTDGGWDTEDVSGTEHTPMIGLSGKVTITLDDGREVEIRQRSTTNIESCMSGTGGSMFNPPEIVARGADEIAPVIDSVADELPGDVERTARRLLRLQSWLDSQTIEPSGNFRVATIYYRPLREQRCFLVPSVTGYKSDEHTPIVVAFNDDDVSDETVKKRCNEIVEKRIADDMHCMGRAHYLHPEDYYDDVESFRAHHPKIHAEEIIEVDSLSEADEIAFEDDDSGETINDNAGEDTQDRQQATLKSFRAADNGGEQ
jgi:hypothetical protein